MGNIYTAGSWYQGEDRLDVSTGSKSAFGAAFAPHPDLERMPRASEAEWQAYAEAYRLRMRHAWEHNQLTFHKLLDKSDVTLVCSCTDAARCHRSLLATYLNKADLERTHLHGERDRLPLVKAALRPQLGRCFAEGCTMSVGADKLMCREDWVLIPKGIQTTLRETFRKGQVTDPAAMSDAYVAAARKAREAVAAAHLKRQRGAKAGAAQ